METSHRALEDVKATITVLRHEAFWAHQKDDLFHINNPFQTSDPSEVAPLVDHDNCGNDGTNLTIPMGNRWKEGTAFTPGSPDPMQQFQQYFTSIG